MRRIATIVALAALGIAGALWLRRDVPPRHNVVLVVLDTLRQDRVGANGYPRDTTPALDALARESVVFTDAITHTPSTPGAHRTLFEGRTQRRGAAPAPIAEILARHGWATAGFTAGGFVHGRFGFAQGFDVYVDDEPQARLAAMAERALAWIDARTGEPFFLFLHTYDVHCPYTPPMPYRYMFTGARRPRFELEGRCGLAYFNTLDMTADDYAILSDIYDGGVRWVDDQLGVFLEALRARGLFRNTVVIVTSDHGEALGEEGVVGHGRLSEEELRVPLIMHIPGFAPATVDEPVQLSDVVPTVLGHLRLEAPAPLDGEDLRPIMRGTETFGGQRLRYSWSPGAGVAVRMGQRWKLVLNAATESRRQLYDLHGDPRRDVADAYPHVADALEAAWQAARAGETPEPLPDPDPEELDPALAERLRALGYLD